MRTIGRKMLCFVLQSEAQYQTTIGNVQVELAYTCDGDVWFAFTERWADISNSMSFRNVRLEEHHEVNRV